MHRDWPSVLLPITGYRLPITNYRLVISRCVHAHLVASAVLVLELHDAVDEGEDGEVAPDADVAAGMPLRAALAHDDAAGAHMLAAELLDAAVLRIAVTAVAGRPYAFLVSHNGVLVLGAPGCC